IGLAPGQTLNAVASVGGALRGNPGVSAWVSKLLGRDMTGTNAISGRTPLDIVNALHKGNMPFWAAQQYGTEVAGVPEGEFTRLWFNLKDANEAYSEQEKRLKAFGINVEKTDNNFNELHKSLTRVSSVFEIIGTQAGSWLAQNVATPALNAVADLLTPSPKAAPQYPTMQDFRHRTPGITAPSRTMSSFYSFANPKERMIHYYEGLGLTTDSATKLAYNNAMEVSTPSGSAGDKINDRLVPFSGKTIKNSAVEMINSTTVAQKMLQN